MLAELLTQVAVVIAVLLVGFVPLCIGRRRLRATRREWRDRMRESAPVASVVLVVLLANRFTRQHLPDLSWAIDWNLTPTFYAIEGEAIIWFQQFASPTVTQYFSFVYIYGYVFILIFPVIAYFALSDTRPLRELLSAYALNYLLGLFLYLLVIAYGPRNIMPGQENTCSTTTAPSTRRVNWRPATVTTAIRELRRTCLQITVRSRSPFARAVRTYGAFSSRSIDERSRRATSAAEAVPSVIVGRTRNHSVSRLKSGASGGITRNQPR